MDDQETLTVMTLFFNEFPSQIWFVLIVLSVVAAADRLGLVIR